MIASKGFAAKSAKAHIEPFTFERRDPGPNDIVIAIDFCGICHSDLHQVNEDWGPSIFPMVPGHEIVGRVTQAGAAVKKFKKGDLAAVGCMVDSCRVCASCKSGEEQYCDKGAVLTYNARDKQGNPTYGGYADNIVVDESFALKISPKLNLAATAPLLCAGITTYSPLRHWKVGKSSKVGIVGLGGLGHMGLKFARAFGAHVVQFTTSLKKTDDALRLGAHEVVLSTNEVAMRAHAATFDFILDTVSADHDLNAYLNLLKRDAVHCLVGLPDRPAQVSAFGLLIKRRSLAGSAIGGIRETQEMLDYCADHNIVSDIEVVPPSKINEAYGRLARNDVKYRFVIDMAAAR
ncbi:MAG TPA: NAD(P)-dependent alcohol dehydrogenase [Candidatus Dormibacteraeota bacterium]|nr:NAD(P)-dependent alcohol dehydrogenase [Candidatus Dormibacteraeota bacterium]